MTDWLILGGWLVGWLLATRSITISMLDREARTRAAHHARLSHPPDEPLIDTEDRVLTLILGAMIGLAWPIALIFLAAARTLRTPTERAATERRELEQLRKLAREHGLPMPEDCR